MAKSVYVESAGEIVEFPDTATPQQMRAYIDRTYGTPKTEVAPPAPTETGPDDSSLLGRAAYGFATGFSDIPGGIASLMYPAEEAAKTTGGQFSEEARKYLQETFGIDPNKDPTFAQRAAQALGSVGSFLVPGAAAAKGASLAGMTLKGAARVGALTASAQGVPLGAEARSEKIRSQIESGMEISPEEQLAAQRLDGLIGAAEGLPVGRFFGPLTTILSKVPASKAPIVEQIIKSRLAKMASAGVAEGAQEVASGVANDIVEYGVYNPDVQIGQDLLSNAGTGAFAGSFVEGVIQLAAGRKLRGARQLQSDLAAEGQQNLAEFRQGQIAQTAEELRRYSVEGPVDIVEEEYDGLSNFRIKAKAGNSFGAFYSPEDAAEAVKLYSDATGAKVAIKPKVEDVAPKVFPIKVGKQKFGSIEEISAARDKAIAEREAVAKFVTDPDLLETKAAELKVSPDMFRAKAFEDVQKRDKFIAKLNAYLPQEPTKQPEIESVTPSVTVEAPSFEPTVSAGPEIKSRAPLRVETEAAEPVSIEQPEAIKARKEIDVPEDAVPIGAVVSPESIEIPEAAVADAVKEEAPVVTAPTEISAERYSAELPAPPEQTITPESPEAIAEPVESPAISAPVAPAIAAPSAAQQTQTAPQAPILALPAARPDQILEPRPYTPEYRAKMERVYTELNNRLSGIVPDNVKLKLTDMINAKNGYLTRGKASRVETPNGVEIIVELSRGIYRPDMTVEAMVQEMAKTLNHEVIHALREAGVFRPSEWNILSKAALNTKVPGKKYTYLDRAEATYRPNGEPISEAYASPDAIVEEAIAEMYKDWVTNRSAPPQTRGLFNRVTEFFRRIFRSLRSNKIDTVFGAVESGEVGGREADSRATQNIEAAEDAKRETNTDAMLSAAPIDPEEFKRWFRNSKAVNSDGTPKVFYHGTPFSFKEFGKGRSASLEGEAGPFYFSDSPKFANQYAETALYGGGGGRDVKKGGRVLPVYLSVQNPFDAENPDHARLVVPAIMDGVASGRIEPRDVLGWNDFAALERAARTRTIDPIDVLVGDEIKKIDRSIRDGKWYQVENRAVQKAIRDLGFDGFYVKESGFKNLAVYSPKQVKSIFNQFEPGTAESSKLSAAPLPPYVEAQNQKIFAPEKKEPFAQRMFDFFLGPTSEDKLLKTVYGEVKMKGGRLGERAMINRKMAIVDQDAYIEWLEKTANEKETGNFQRREATQSALAALHWARRSTQLTASTILQGAPVIEFSKTGDIQSATVAVREDADNLLGVFKVLLEPGPVNPVTGERDDKRGIFKSYAIAMRGRAFRAAGMKVPDGLDDTYINTTIPFVEKNYPEIVEAYKSYQRFNKKMLTAARDAGRISDQDLANFTKKMDYYGFFREFYEEQLVPGLPSKMAGEIKVREYRGSERGNLIEDPMTVIVANVNFWMGAITRNIAVNKAFKLAKDMGEARLLGASEKPNVDAGESEQVMFFRENGVLKRFAVKDPMLVTSLGSDDRIDMGQMMKLLGTPTGWLRESITRDPAFMIANLIRDTLSSWITSGENITPFVGTAKGFADALRGTASYKALVGRGVVGSHDLAMREPAEIAAIIRRRAMPKNIINIASVEGAQNMAMSLWDRLGAWSEASDAATRIAVYESAIAQGMSEAEAAFRAIEIMNFSRRGSSAFLGVLTKLIPFLNARIQGMDVLYQAGKAGILTASGYRLGERDANLGKKFLVRGAILAALSVALEMALEDDEDYADLPDYVKNGNLLIPLKWFGIEGGYFAAIAKPFEAGLLFSTIPQEMYKATTGETSGREMAKFFWSEFVSTFGLNPMPQAALPIFEVITNYDMYTDLPLVSEGKARLAPQLQYDARTSSVAMMLSGIPIKYNFTTGKFEGVSPIIIDQLISGYGGPFGSYIMQGVGMAMEATGASPERLPRDITQLPVIKRFLLDAESRNPKSVAQAYELFRVVDEANRSFSRLRQIGDAEAIADYLEENKDVLAYKKYFYKLFDGLNKISAQERRIEMDQKMTRDEKIEAVKKLREVRARLTSQIETINQKLGR